MFEQQPPPAQRNFYFYLSTVALISLFILLTLFSWKALNATAQQGTTTYREAPADFEGTCNKPYRSHQKYSPSSATWTRESGNWRKRSTKTSSLPTSCPTQTSPETDQCHSNSERPTTTPATTLNTKSWRTGSP